MFVFAVCSVILVSVHSETDNRLDNDVSQILTLENGAQMPYSSQNEGENSDSLRLWLTENNLSDVYTVLLEMGISKRDDLLICKSENGAVDLQPIKTELQNRGISFMQCLKLETAVNALNDQIIGKSLQFSSVLHSECQNINLFL